MTKVHFALIVVALVAVCLSAGPVLAQHSTYTAANAPPSAQPVTAGTVPDSGTVPLAVPLAVPSAGAPLTKVVLFTSGVGYFEHNGHITGDSTLQLGFKAEQMNDILKSLVILTSSKDFTSSVTYAGKEPVIHALKGFAIDLSGMPTMADLLRQVRGEEVAVMTPEKIVGKVISVEARQEAVPFDGSTKMITRTYLNLATAAGLKSVNVESVQAIQLTNEKLQAELAKALELLATAHDLELKPVDISFSGKGAADVKVAYITEMPIWETSYRLDLSAEKPLIQGWAIVNNTTDQDWSKIRLSLVSGRPISFIQDMYTPLFVPRPVVVPELYASLRPQTYEEGIELAGKLAKPGEDGRAGRAAMGIAPAATPGGGGGGGYGLAKDKLAEQGHGWEQQKMELARGVAAAAAGAKVGELFEFTVQRAVDLPRRRSAMLPIINSPIAAQKVSIYNPSVLPRNPLTGAYITNDTKMTLPGGPITVFDQGAYAGDARIEYFAPDQKRLISYAIDQKMTINTEPSSTTAITGAKIVRGVMTIFRKYTYTQVYKIENMADAKRTLIIEQPIVAGRKLVEPPEKDLLEKAANMYRFRTELDAKAKDVKYEVKEEQTAFESITLLQGDIGTMTTYWRTNEIPAKVRDALGKAVDLRQALAKLEAQRDELTRQKQQLQADQDRQRRNLEAVGRGSQAAQRYTTALGELEDKIIQVTKDLDDLQKKIDDARKAYQDYVSALNVE